jgi:predicted house-cleaning noncanonical NTP pyrophosphatase (MazG superfamily)
MNYRTFNLNKLVRDKITEMMKQLGQIPGETILSEDATKYELRRKIVEEASEMNVDNPEDVLSELADIQECVDSLLRLSGKTKEDLLIEQNKKREKSGSFEKGHYIDKLQVPTGTEWAEYYAKEPDRFSEDK